jgi:hypothetical protein
MKDSIADSLALVPADILKLCRRRGLAVMTAALMVGLVTVSYAIPEALHARNPAKNPLPGGAAKLGNAIFIPRHVRSDRLSDRRSHHWAPPSSIMVVVSLFRTQSQW